jgi:hypothetical protein
MDGGLARRASGLMASFEKIPVEGDPEPSANGADHANTQPEAEQPSAH